MILLYIFSRCEQYFFKGSVKIITQIHQNIANSLKEPLHFHLSDHNTPKRIYLPKQKKTSSEKKEKQIRVLNLNLHQRNFGANRRDAARPPAIIFIAALKWNSFSHVWGQNIPHLLTKTPLCPKKMQKKMSLTHRS